ncbi:hypothetical protein CP532_6396 [Ophiocordyceps camponoti-leonardi (nom. inval.)]|nr:hypothetical protein CP532_6396 [Ophiocordyceps camponoti-leonardi (nom. inval.)]
MARKKQAENTNNASTSKDREEEENSGQESSTYRLYQGTLLAGYEDRIRNELMDLVHQIEMEAGPVAEGEQREVLADLVASFVEAHATTTSSREEDEDDGGDEEEAEPLLEEEKMERVLASVRAKVRETVDGQSGKKGTAYGKLINWYRRELEKISREKV